ncbi:MAG: hypothetical protein WCT20_00195 [Candidatus Babeliales bacterium]
MVDAIYEERWFLALLFTCALIIRTCIFSCYLGNDNRFWQVDSNTYHVIGTEMARGNGYSLPGGQPAFYRLPGYPFFISLCYKLFGHEKQNVLWAQIVIASFIPILVFLLSLTLFPGYLQLAKISSLISACHLGLVLYSGFFMSESLFIFFFLLFAIFFFSHLDSVKLPFNKSFLRKQESSHLFFWIPASAGMTQKKTWLLTKSSLTNLPLFLAGVFLGCASLIRPVGHYLIVVAIVLLLFQYKALYKKIYDACTLTIGWAIPVSFLLVRNYLLLGSLFFHTLPGGHFLYLSAARVAMHPHHCSYQEARKILHTEVEASLQMAEKAKGSALNEIERCIIHEKLACSYFISYPLITLRYWITDMLRAMFSLYSAELLYLSSGRKEVDYFAKDRTTWSMFKRYLVPETDNPLLRFIIWGEILLFLFMLLGFGYGFVHMLFWGAAETRCTWFKVLPFMMLFIVISLAGGYARMRLPIEPFLIIFSIYGWSSLKNKD